MKKILYFVQLPPPIHGVSVCNQRIITSKNLNSTYKTKVIPLNFNDSHSGIRNRSLSKFLKMIPITLKLISALLFFRPNIVYFTLTPIGDAFKRDLLFIFILKIFRTKILYHIHGKGIALEKSSIMKRLYRSAFHNTSVICLSPELTKDIDDVKSNASIFICENGVEKPKLNQVYSKTKTTKQKVSLLFLSNLSPLKGINLYLEAASLLINKGYDIEINIAGPFTDRYTKDDYDNFLSLNPALKNVINYHGSVQGNTKWQVLNDADILVHPTHNDAFPLVILEALGAGCAVVSTTQGGIPDILKGKPYGSILPEVSANCLFNRLAYLCEHKDKFEGWSKAAITDFEKKYTIEKFEQRLSDILKTL